MKYYGIFYKKGQKWHGPAYKLFYRSLREAKCDAKIFEKEELKAKTEVREAIWKKVN